jgi:hypothetical protein
MSPYIARRVESIAATAQRSFFKGSFRGPQAAAPRDEPAIERKETSFTPRL